MKNTKSPESTKSEPGTLVHHTIDPPALFLVDTREEGHLSFEIPEWYPKFRGYQRKLSKWLNMLDLAEWLATNHLSICWGNIRALKKAYYAEKMACLAFIRTRDHERLMPSQNHFAGGAEHGILVRDFAKTHGVETSYITDQNYQTARYFATMPGGKPILASAISLYEGKGILDHGTESFEREAIPRGLEYGAIRANDASASQWTTESRPGNFKQRVVKKGWHDDSVRLRKW